MFHVPSMCCICLIIFSSYCAIHWYATVKLSLPSVHRVLSLNTLSCGDTKWTKTATSQNPCFSSIKTIHGGKRSFFSSPDIYLFVCVTSFTRHETVWTFVYFLSFYFGPTIGTGEKKMDYPTLPSTSVLKMPKQRHRVSLLLSPTQPIVFSTCIPSHFPHCPLHLLPSSLLLPSLLASCESYVLHFATF